MPPTLELQLPPKQYCEWDNPDGYRHALAWRREVYERLKQVSMAKERHRKSQDEFEEVRYYTELLQESVAQEAAWRERAAGSEKGAAK